jgi:hypothetical protein
MNRIFYKLERKKADVLFYVTELLLIVAFVQRAFSGEWKAAIFFAAIAVIFVILRFVKGPLVGPALLEVTEQELIWKSLFYFPTKIKKYRLESIKALKIAGPRGDRCFRVALTDGSEEEFRPYYGRVLESKIIHFLKSSLPKNIPVIEEDPPSVLSQLRGDF